MIGAYRGNCAEDSENGLLGQCNPNLFSLNVETILDRIVPGSVKTIPIPSGEGRVPSIKIRYWLDAELVRGGSATLFPGAQIDMQPNGSAIVTAHTTDLWEARLMLLSYGAGCKVLEPSQLVKDVQAEVLKMARHYGVNLSDGWTLERNMTEQQRSRSEG